MTAPLIHGSEHQITGKGCRVVLRPLPSMAKRRKPPSCMRASYRLKQSLAVFTATFN